MSISCRNLQVTHHGRHLLAVDLLEVADGETVAVLGPNGAGKSTLLRALARLEPATGGEVLLDGEPVVPAQLRAAVAAVLQRPVLQRASVLDNAAAGLRLRGLRRAAAHRLARPWLDALGIAHLADRHARMLSGGETQRVAIARALAVQSRVLLLDEPFAGLDATIRADLIADLRTALDQSTAAVLLVTHDRDEAAALAHRTALLLRGRIRQLGTTADVLDSPADPECARLLGYTTHLPPELTGHDASTPHSVRGGRPAPDRACGGRRGHAAQGRAPGGNHAGRRRHLSGPHRRPDHHRGHGRTGRSAVRRGRHVEHPGVPTPGMQRRSRTRPRVNVQLVTDDRGSS